MNNVKLEKGTYQQKMVSSIKEIPAGYVRQSVLANNVPADGSGLSDAAREGVIRSYKIVTNPAVIDGTVKVPRNAPCYCHEGDARALLDSIHQRRNRKTKEIIHSVNIADTTVPVTVSESQPEDIPVLVKNDEVVDMLRDMQEKINGMYDILNELK